MVSVMSAVAAAASVRTMHALVVTHALGEGTPDQHAELCSELTPAVAAVPGLVSVTWLANRLTGRYGAYYVFANKAACDRYLASELFGLLRAHPLVRRLTTSDFTISNGGRGKK